jgi:hypothetical protein
LVGRLSKRQMSISGHPKLSLVNVSVDTKKAFRKELAEESKGVSDQWFALGRQAGARPSGPDLRFASEGH